CAVSWRRFADHLHAARLQKARDRSHVGRVDAKTEVVDVRRRRVGAVGRRQQVEHAPPAPQLHEPDPLDATFLGESEYVDVERERTLGIATSEHDVIELLDAQRAFHGPLLLPQWFEQGNHPTRVATAVGCLPRAGVRAAPRGYGTGTYSTLGRRAAGCGKSC